MLSTEALKHQPDLRSVAVALLQQLADDDMVLGFRDQEWLGLAPHIEEDVAFGSISQEEIGHAAHYFRLLEEMGEGTADDLASLRPARLRRNAVLLEQPNGPGHYLDAPHYDWAFTIVRHYLHDVWEMTVLEGLQASRWTALAEVAVKVLGEKRYHRAHQELWMSTLAKGGQDTRPKLEDAIQRVVPWLGDLPDWGGIGGDLEQTGLLAGARGLTGRYWDQIGEFFRQVGLEPIAPVPVGALNGRLGQHTPALDEVLASWSEVYRSEPGARW